jgi:hypothetical protein
MKPMNRAEQLPKFKRIGDRIAKLRGLLLVWGLLFGTVSEVYGAIVLPPRVSADGRYLAGQSGVPAFLVADAPQAAFALPSSSQRAIDLASRQAFRKEK